MKNIFIINPVAGNGKIQKSIESSVKTAAQNLKCDNCICYTTKNKGDIYKYISSLDRMQEYNFFACGGDGTLRDVVNAIKKLNFINANVGTVPCGTGNDFVRAFENSDNFLDISSQLLGEVQKIDLIMVNDDYCVNLANIGFDANVADKMVSYKKMFGKFSYIVAVAKELFSSMKYHMQFEFDDKTEENGNFLLLSAANGIAYGGGFYSAPLSIMNDGMIDVCYCNNVSRIKFLAAVSKYKKGEHLTGKYPFIHRKVCKNLKLHTDLPIAVCQDGEITQQSNIFIKIQNNALNLIVPKGCSFKNK